MKKVHRHVIVLAAALAAATVSCNKEEGADTPVSGYTLSFSGSLDYADGSGKCCNRYWDGIGTVTLFDLTAGTAGQVRISPTGDYASMMPDSPVSGKACAILPGSDAFSVSNGQLVVTVPASPQKADVASLFAFADVAKGRLEFRNICALAKVSVDEPEVFTSISLSGDDSEKICGIFSLNPSRPDEGLAGGTAKKIRFTPSEGSLGKGDYYIQFAPVTIKSGLTLELAHKDGTVYSKTLATSPAAGQVADFGSSSQWAVEGNRLNPRNHPRILMNETVFSEVKARCKTDADLQKIHGFILNNASTSIGTSALKFKLDDAGKRILSVSREAIRQILSCAYAYRYTGQEKYLKQAELQLQAVCRFSSWNAKSHFLDVGEMCVAVGLGYDWLHDALSEETRELIVKAIRDYAFKPVFTKQWSQNFFNTEGNWEQVCCSGLTVAALAIHEECPEDAQKILDQCIESNLRIAPILFSPDGNYPEGYGYWGYGCDFQALMNSALETALGVDNYPRIAGIRKTPRYFMYMEGPAGYNYCYYDTSPNSLGTGLAMWYFAAKAGDPSIVANEMLKIKSGGCYNGTGEGIRLLPMIMPWMASLDLTSISGPSDKLYVGNGATPVIAGRSAWSSLKNDSDVYFGFKGGKAGENHGHMDAGSFVFDAQGVRWAWDFTRPAYATIENALKAAGGNFWAMTQNSLRWTVNVMNNKFHNTLTVNGADHLVGGFAPITGSVNKKDEYGGTIALTPALSNEIASAIRTVVLRNDRDLVVTDELKALPSKAASVEWRMVSPAAATIEGDHIKLTKNGKTEYLKVASGTPFTLTLFDKAKVNSYDSDISSYSVIGFKAELPAGASASFTTVISSVE